MTESFLIAPFNDFAFLRRALAACIILSVGGAPLGFFMNQRRMALVSDAMSHAILPGVAVAFLIAGMGVWSLTLGGLCAGILIALFAVYLIRHTKIKEDAVFTLFFLLSLTSGFVLLSLKGSNIDLMHMLFGDVLAINRDALIFIFSVTALTLFSLAFIYRGLLLDCFDPDFLTASGRGRIVRPAFFVLFVVNLVAAFQALGTLMALGLILLPAIAARFWTRHVTTAILFSVALAILASYSGLLLAFYADTPAGATVVLVCAVLCLLSVLAGRYGSLWAETRRQGPGVIMTARSERNFFLPAAKAEAGDGGQTALSRPES
ncbi:MAG: metal ABC transporter permease [Alphaproteobacteria bacterium]|nr:metal ABC transporter permease [Alphaproteobacteria bacterium]